MAALIDLRRTFEAPKAASPLHLVLVPVGRLRLWHLDNWHIGNLSDRWRHDLHLRWRDQNANLRCWNHKRVWLAVLAPFSGLGSRSAYNGRRQHQCNSHRHSPSKGRFRGDSLRLARSSNKPIIQSHRPIASGTTKENLCLKPLFDPIDLHFCVHGFNHANVGEVWGLG